MPQRQRSSGVQSVALTSKEEIHVTYQQLVDLIKSTGGNVVAQQKSVTPAANEQVVEPDSGYNALSKVTVNAIPILRDENANGTTVTIG